MKSVPELFGSLAFNEATMRERLPKNIYNAVKRTMATGESLSSDVANVVANAMKDWALEKGATHYTHWFHPMTGITAEKHDSFISPTENGGVIMEFSGKSLIKGEPDASSFPSGGLRATFEARGYTAWDPTSYAFIKEGTLCIPTAFYSYSGEALDQKTPLLRSMEAINSAALRVLRLLGNTTARRVTTTVGAEQEYFLVPKELYEKRRDLVYTGRTLFGAKPPKGQELEDHYFGSIKPRVSAYMHDLDEELWKLGIFAKTEHNETAPSQHELAPIFTTTNVACDHNQLIMEMMKKVALRHGLVCLLHEKPFAGVNGSGKHNNWSLSTDMGENLLKPGKKPHENKQFLLFLAAMIKAVDEHQDLVRISVATAGNDHRLGAHEAPPAIVSMFIGTDLEKILDSIEKGSEYIPDSATEIDTSVEALPNLYKDTTDRNRTSPFAFTGDKFEFRMLGSSISIANPNIVLNTIVAAALNEFAARLEKEKDSEAVDEEIIRIIKDVIKDNGRIIFNGNNYSMEWVDEAERRRLLNMASSAEALPHFSDEKNIALFEKFKVFSRNEVKSRAEILSENYCKVLKIEALTMIEMVNREILPAGISFTKLISESALAKKSLSDTIPCDFEVNLVKRLSALCASISKSAETLDKALCEDKNYIEAASRARYFRDTVLATMQELRGAADELETLVGKDFWPMPTYGDLLFGV